MTRHNKPPAPGEATAYPAEIDPFDASRADAREMALTRSGDRPRRRMTRPSCRPGRRPARPVATRARDGPPAGGWRPSAASRPPPARRARVRPGRPPAPPSPTTCARPPQRVGVPAYEWGLDQGDIDAIAARRRPVRAQRGDRRRRRSRAGSSGGLERRGGVVAVTPPPPCRPRCHPRRAAAVPARAAPATRSGRVAVAGLAREVDALRRTVEPLLGLPDRVDDLTRLATDLTNAVAALTARRAATPCPSWLLLPADPDLAGRVLDELAGWLAVVYLRYPDGADHLPECWCWHPDVVEELLWLMHAWAAAYQGPQARSALVGDWHDRQRPGVVRRIRPERGVVLGREPPDPHRLDPPPLGRPDRPRRRQHRGRSRTGGATRRDQDAPEPPPGWPPSARGHGHGRGERRRTGEAAGDHTHATPPRPHARTGDDQRPGPVAAGGRAVRAVIWLPGLAVAVGAAVATAHGLFEVALAARVPAGIAWLYPLITDGLALVAYAATARLRGRPGPLRLGGRRARRRPVRARPGRLPRRRRHPRRLPGAAVRGRRLARGRRRRRRAPALPPRRRPATLPHPPHRDRSAAPRRPDTPADEPSPGTDSDVPRRCTPAPRPRRPVPPYNPVFNRRCTPRPPYNPTRTTRPPTRRTDRPDAPAAGRAGVETAPVNTPPSRLNSR